MYAVKEKKNVSLYKRYSPQFPTHQETEMEVYIAHSVGKSITKDMKTMVRCISGAVVHDFSTEGK